MNKTKRFIVGKETILDTKTGIIWQRDLCKYGKFNFTESLELAKKENKQVPTREDWQSLNNGEYPTLKTLEEIGFINAGLWYWTYDEYNIATAWFVSLTGGNNYYGTKTVTCYVTLIEKNE